MRLAQAILETLERCHVDTVFGVPGNHNVELYRYLPDSGLRHVTARHEQGVGFMADGYARASGRTGVCFVISGPGVTNIATPMGQALGDSVPMLVIATVGDQHQPEGRLHELPDQLALAREVSVQAIQPASADEVCACLANVLLAPQRPGPHYLQIPLSWWQADVELPALPSVPSHAPDPAALDTAAGMIEEAQRPLLLAGGGCQDAGSELARLAGLLGAPVVQTANAKGILRADHPQFVGGSPSVPVVRELVQKADLLVAVGTELGETDYDLLMIGDMQFTAPMVRIDIDPQAVHKGAAPAIAVIGDARETLRAFAETLTPRAPWIDLKATRTGLGKHPHHHADFEALFAAIDDACPEAVIVGDSTRPTYYATWMWERPATRHYFHSVSGYGTLGYALPAAIGAQLAAPGATVIGIIGDGGLMFTLGELAVAVHQRLPIKLLVWDNSGYQEIAHSMAARDIDAAATQYMSPDFEALARGFGAAYSAPTDLGGLKHALIEAADRPHVIVLREGDFVNGESGDWY